jgi:8-oxo-dGTP pyrophosphatase MutT (NUDIX family)
LGQKYAAAFHFCRMNQPDTLALMREYHTDWPGEAEYLQQTIAFVERTPFFWRRSTLEGHLTGSAWVLAPDGAAALLIHHAKLDRWLQPGGHADDTDEDLAATARREAQEECGLSGLRLHSPAIFDLDVHEIPARGHEPAHLHYDLRFLFFAPAESELLRNQLEIKDMAWHSLVSLCGDSTPLSLRRMAQKAFSMLNIGKFKIAG